MWLARPRDLALRDSTGICLPENGGHKASDQNSSGSRASSTSLSQNMQAKQKRTVFLSRVVTAMALLAVTFAAFAVGEWGVLLLLFALCAVGCDEAACMLKSNVKWRVGAVALGLVWMGWLCWDTVSPHSANRLYGFVFLGMGAAWASIMLEWILTPLPPSVPRHPPPVFVPVVYIATGVAVLYALWLEGGFAFTCVLLGTWVHDSLAYACGRLYGRHPMCSHISKGKTWEGFAGGILGAVALLMVVWALRHRLPWLVHDSMGFWDALGLGIGCSIGAVLGDLIESQFKRVCQVKDSSQLLPGHGGVLDRIDGLVSSGMFALVWLNWPS